MDIKNLSEQTPMALVDWLKANKRAYAKAEAIVKQYGAIKTHLGKVATDEDLEAIAGDVGTATFTNPAKVKKLKIDDPVKLIKKIGLDKAAPAISISAAKLEKAVGSVDAEKYITIEEGARRFNKLL